MSRYQTLLHPIQVRDHVLSWLREDVPNFDYGGFVVGEKYEEAVILCKSPTGVIAGQPFVDCIFKELDCTVEWLLDEGTEVKQLERVGIVRGKARHLLLGERVALNCLARASGVATTARKLRKIKDDRKWRGEIAGTRKTTPGFRLVEKYALEVGGISTHRNDLSSMIMLKDNHIWTAGNITQAVKDARSVGGFSIKIEVECRSVGEAKEAAEAGADIVMLDNFSQQAVQEASDSFKSQFPHVLLECSGGITETTIAQYMLQNVDVISLSSVTQGYDVVNFSMKILKEGRDPTNPLVRIKQS